MVGDEEFWIEAVLHFTAGGEAFRRGSHRREMFRVAGSISHAGVIALIKTRRVKGPSQGELPLVELSGEARVAGAGRKRNKQRREPAHRLRPEHKSAASGACGARDRRNVLNNWRRHREDVASLKSADAHLDPYSTGIAVRSGGPDRSGVDGKLPRPGSRRLVQDVRTRRQAGRGFEAAGDVLARDDNNRSAGSRRRERAWRCA